MAKPLASTSRAKNEVGLKNAYQINRESLLLAWSPQAQALLNHYLILNRIAESLKAGQAIKASEFELRVKLQPERQLPPLVDEPERFEEVVLTIPYDKLLLDKTPANIYQLREAYYYSIPKNFAAAPQDYGVAARDVSLS